MKNLSESILSSTGTGKEQILKQFEEWLNEHVGEKYVCWAFSNSGNSISLMYNEHTDINFSDFPKYFDDLKIKIDTLLIYDGSFTISGDAEYIRFCRLIDDSAQIGKLMDSDTSTVEIKLLNINREIDMEKPLGTNQFCNADLVMRKCRKIDLSKGIKIKGSLDIRGVKEIKYPWMLTELEDIRISKVN